MTNGDLQLSSQQWQMDAGYLLSKGVRPIAELTNEPGIIVASSKNGWMNKGLTKDLRTETNSDDSAQEEKCCPVTSSNAEEPTLDTKDLAATSSTGYIKELITRFDFDFLKMVSQGYDGANVMSGHGSGVQT
uniref:Uncharacterized protein n=1 Tax=Amphimedon queenslandica TaxID=400682 RepID=A0A1X7U6W7_AMPQE